MAEFFSRNVTVLAALVAASLVATPLVMSASNAFATAEERSVAAMPAAVAPVEAAPIAAPATRGEICTRKVRVVYSGYGTPDAACTTR